MSIFVLIESSFEQVSLTNANMTEIWVNNKYVRLSMRSEFSYMVWQYFNSVINVKNLLLFFFFLCDNRICVYELIWDVYMFDYLINKVTSICTIFTIRIYLSNQISHLINQIRISDIQSCNFEFFFKLIPSYLRFPYTGYVTFYEFRLWGEHVAY